MCRAEGMALCPWGTLGSGRFKTEAQRQSQEGRQVSMTGKEDRMVAVSKALESVANRKETQLTSVVSFLHLKPL